MVLRCVVHRVGIKEHRLVSHYLSTVDVFLATGLAEFGKRMETRFMFGIDEISSFKVLDLS